MILLPKTQQNKDTVISIWYCFALLYCSVTSKEKSNVTPVIYSENEFELIRFCK